MDELLDELRDRTQREFQDDCHALAADLPILHRAPPGSTVEAAKHLLATGRIDLRPGAGSPVRQILGTANCTFFWVGFQAYEPADLIFVWEPMAELAEPAGVAAPWDTGGLLGSCCGVALSADRAIATLGRYSLPVPDYRRYVGAVLATCYEHAQDYLVGAAPNHWYPCWSSSGTVAHNPPAHTFELRRAGPVSVANGLVAAIFDPHRVCQFAENAARPTDALPHGRC